MIGYHGQFLRMRLITGEEENSSMIINSKFLFGINFKFLDHSPWVDPAHNRNFFTPAENKIL